MSKPVDFPEKTHLLGPPEGAEAYVQDLPVHSDGMYCTSCWELDEEELREVAKTRRVWVSIMSGRTQPPVLVLGISPLEQTVTLKFENTETGEQIFVETSRPEWSQEQFMRNRDSNWREIK